MDNHPDNQKKTSTYSKPRPSRQTACDCCRVRRVKCDAHTRKENGFDKCTQCDDKDLKCTFDYKHTPKAVKKYRGNRIEKVRQTQVDLQDDDIWTPSEDMLDRMIESAKYPLISREAIYPVIQYASKYSRSPSAKLFRYILASIGVMWSKDPEVLGMPYEEVDGTPTSKIQETRLNVLRKVHKHVSAMIDDIVGSISKADPESLVALLIYVTVPTPEACKPSHKYTGTMITEFVMRRSYIEFRTNYTNMDPEIGKNILCSAFLFDTYICLLTGKLASIRPEDIFMSHEMLSWENGGDEPPWQPNNLDCDPLLSIKDSAVLTHYLFANFTTAKALRENLIKSPAPKYEVMLSYLSNFRSFHRRVFSLAHMSIGSISQKNQVFYAASSLNFGLLCIKLWELTLHTKKTNSNFTSSETRELELVMRKVKRMAVYSVFENARMIEWSLKSSAMQSKIAGNLKSSLHWDPLLYCLYAAVAVRTLNIWKKESFVTADLVSWASCGGDEFTADWNIGKAINLYSFVITECSGSIGNPMMARQLIFSDEDIESHFNKVNADPNCGIAPKTAEMAEDNMEYGPSSAQRKSPKFEGEGEKNYQSITSELSNASNFSNAPDEPVSGKPGATTKHMNLHEFSPMPPTNGTFNSHENSTVTLNASENLKNFDGQLSEQQLYEEFAASQPQNFMSALQDLDSFFGLGM